MFKFVLGHSKAWLSFNRFITVYKKLFTSRKTAQLRSRFVSLFGVRQTRLSPPAFRQMNLTLCIRAPSCFSLLSQNLSRLFHCSVIKVVCRSRFKRQLLYLTKVICFCQELFLFIFADRLICFPVARDSLFILSPGTAVVNTFFLFFSNFYTAA